jgi:hypothetical protein
VEWGHRDKDMDLIKIFNVLSKINVTPNVESLNEIKEYFSSAEMGDNYTICQRLRWIKNQNVDLYNKHKEPIYLAIFLIADEAHGMAKKMNDKLVEYKG